MSLLTCLVQENSVSNGSLASMGRDDLLLGFAAGMVVATTLAAMQRYLLMRNKEGVSMEHDDDASSDDDAAASPSRENAAAPPPVAPASPPAAPDAAAAAPSSPPKAAVSPPSLLQMRKRSSSTGELLLQKLQRVTTATQLVSETNSMTHVDRRYLAPPRETLELCRGTLAGNSSRPWEASRQNWFIAACSSPGTSSPRVHNRLWVSYRMWVDEHVAGREGRPDIFHNFVLSRALGIPQSGRFSWTGTEAGDLLTCLAAAGVLVRGCQGGKAALEQFLEDSLQAYNNRFRLARNRTVEGLTRAEQCDWAGPFDFVQIADPQIGMFKMDSDW